MDWDEIGREDELLIRKLAVHLLPADILERSEKGKLAAVREAIRVAQMIVEEASGPDRSR